ncbi:MAG: hypothetical protein J6T17_00225 [Clostridia bacterium]|nr:hypothetical protein [Clostridia bacterium]
MEIDRTITNLWTIVLEESEVFERVTDESLMASYQRAPENPKEDGTVITDDDRAFFERYYRAALAELSALLAKRTYKYGGSISNDRDPETGFITTTYTLAMTINHESGLVQSLASHCLEFIIAKVLEKWYGRGTDFGSETERQQIRHILNYRRFCIERPGRPL